MKTRWLARRTTYDGRQLRPHWILASCGLVGDALVGFRGPCAVPEHEMADQEDRLAAAVIAGDDMVHLVMERFDDGDLDRATLRQRLLAAVALDVLRARAKPRQRLALCRSGDDLFCGEGKLSISVATRSPVSTLIHFAVNVSNAGTPVRTAALDDLGVEPVAFARATMAAWAREEAGVTEARCRVRARSDS